MEGGEYGTHLNVYDWTQRKLIQRIDLGQEGVMPLEIRSALVISLPVFHNCAAAPSSPLLPLGFVTGLQFLDVLSLDLLPLGVLSLDVLSLYVLLVAYQLT